MSDTNNWFVSWFNTGYYHTLYKDRDDSEAIGFMQNLVSFLNLNKGDRLLDLACGKGRHAVYLNSMGFDVVGADLSENSIRFAKKFENKKLKFVEHDMRKPFESKFDAIFNLFTSFGFFEDDSEDIKVLENIKNGLNPNGIAIIDFMNSKKVIANLIPEESKTVESIKFHINRYVQNGFIVKEINFDDNDEHHKYFEKVKILNIPKINSYLNAVDFKIKYIFGDYKLSKFDEEFSDRLILILE